MVISKVHVFSRIRDYSCSGFPKHYHKYNKKVCAWFKSYILCFRYPCAYNAANSFQACSNLDVEYYTIGKCPS